MVVNRFRGDPALLTPGLDWFEARTGVSVLGVVPWLEGLYLEAEDALARRPERSGEARLRVVIPALPRISNHTDFDALALQPEINLAWVGPGQTPPSADLVILPGSKSVRADLDWLRAGGWAEYLARHLRYGGRVLGICGGLQMLGRELHDPDGVEGKAGSSAGLGWLDVETTLTRAKQLHRVEGRLAPGGARVTGYETHMGVTRGADAERPLVRLADRDDGARSADGSVIGTYLHGVFDHPEARRELLAWAGLADVDMIDHTAERERGIDRLAAAVESAMDLDALLRRIGAIPRRE